MEKANLILLHGALGSKNQFRAILPLLNTKFVTHSFNFEGHGGNPSKRPFSIIAFGENLIDFMDEHNISASHIFGYSMGGYVALNAALEFPKRILNIMTLATKIDWNPTSAKREVGLLNPDKMLEKIPAFVNALKKRHGIENWRNVILNTADMMTQLGNGGATKLDDFKKIASPTTICVGELDTMVTEEESAKVASLIPEAKFKLIPQTKHPLEVVNKPMLARLIKQFL